MDLHKSVLKNTNLAIKEMTQTCGKLLVNIRKIKIKF
jgi:hypothetical protein